MVAFRQILFLIKHQIGLEFHSKANFLTPLLFACTVLVAFSFAFGEIAPAEMYRNLVAELYLTTFFALQMVFTRAFSEEGEDKAWDVIKTYSIPASHLFWAKYFSILIICFAIFVPTLVIAVLLLGIKTLAVIFFPIVAVGLLVLLGLVPLGILLSVITRDAKSRQLLYPILYFPLTTPALLTGVHATFLYLENLKFTNDAWNWLGLLAAFDVVFITLGVLLFIEFIDLRQISEKV